MGSNADLTYRWFEELWNKDNEGTIDEMMVPDVVAHGLGPDFVGREQFRSFYRQFREPFSSIQLTLDRVVEADDETAYRGHADAVTRRGEKVVFDGAGFIRFEGGRIVEGWNYWDFLALAIQTRVVHATVMEDALQAAGVA